MTDLDLFTAPAPSHRAPTSRAAAHSLARDLGRLRLRVLEHLATLPHPATREEIAAGAGLRLQSVCGRVNELLNAKGRHPWPALLEAAGRRETASGRWAEAVTLSEAGREMLREVGE